MNLDLTKKINKLICKKSNSNTLKIEEDYREISSGIQLLLESQEIVEKELNILKKEREEKVSRKEARVNRKRLPRRDQVTREIYDLLIQASGSPVYTSVRLRIAFCLLTMTGIRINELLPLKVGQIQTLLEAH